MTQKQAHSSLITTTKDHAAWMTRQDHLLPWEGLFRGETQPGKAWDKMDLISVEYSYKLMTFTKMWRM